MADHQRAPVRDDRAPAPDTRTPTREERVVVEERRSSGIGSFLGGIAKAGMWMILGVIVAVIVLLALIF